MQRKFRLDDDNWNEFLSNTDNPSETIRQLIINFNQTKKIESNPLDYVIGVDKASEQWGLSAGYIKNLCAAGKMNCIKIGKTWVIDKTQDNPKQENTNNESSEIENPLNP